MIFYFTGTGNSYYVANQLRKKGERLVNMAKARDEKEYQYTVAKGESVGFVFPVYCWTVCDVVLDLIRNLRLEGARYVYSVITCGGSIGCAGGLLRKELKKRGITLSCVYPLVMPDNCLLFYNNGTEEHQKEVFRNCQEKLSEICTEIRLHRIRKPLLAFPARICRSAYHMLMGTKKYHVTDKCTGCGLCAKNCPDHAIQMVDGRPVWEKKKCAKCTACINRCPVGAIEYGKATADRARYNNPAAFRQSEQDDEGMSF